MDSRRDRHVVEALMRMADALRQQDRDAFYEALVDLLETPGDEAYPSYDTLAFSRALELVRSSADAEDVVAGSVARLLRAAARTFEEGDDGGTGKLGIEKLLGRPKPAAAVGKYLSTTVTNLGKDLIRARRVVPVADETLRAIATESGSLSGGDQLQLDQDEQIVLSLALKDALGRLDPGLELTLRLVFFDQWTHAEVAEVFEVGRSTVSSWVKTGLSQLREQLAE